MSLQAIGDAHPTAGALVGAAHPTLAFEDEVKPHLQSLYHRALRLTRDPEAANDLVQDTLERGYRKRALFAPGTDLRAWLLSIMRNLWINRHRRRSGEPSLVSLETLDEVALHRRQTVGASRSSVVEQTVAETLGEAALLTMIHALPPPYRDVVVLADVEGLPYKAVAETLHVPVGSVCSRLSRARERLRRALDEQGYGVELLPKAG